MQYPYKVKDAIMGDGVKRDNELEVKALRKFLQAFSTVLPIHGTVSTKSRLSTDEFVMFLPDIAYQNKDGEIVAGVQAWVYEKEQRRGLTKMLALLLGIDIASLSAKDRSQLFARTQLFRVDCERGKELLICDDKGHIYQMPKTANNGRSQILAPVQLEDINSIKCLKFHLMNAAFKEQADTAMALYAPLNGISIISDIDDTIKISSVGDKKKLLRNTFLEDFSAVADMADFYQEINNGHIAYHYVSSSPIQLYPVLYEFLIKNSFPFGSMHLREATRWTDIVPLSSASKSHKTLSIMRLLKAYPQRKFVLIGDSSENDPSLYASFKEQFPKNILGIIIRNVTPEKTKENFSQIFANIDESAWLVSANVDEMRDFMTKILQK